MAYLEGTVAIKAPLEAVYSLAKKMDDFPNYMPDVKSIKIIENLENSTVSEWVSAVEDMEVRWTEQEWYDDEVPRITYKLLEGDLDKFDGSWEFEPYEGGTKVTLKVTFDFGIPALEDLLGPTLNLKVRENINMMLTSLKTKIEGETKSLN